MTVMLRDSQRVAGVFYEATGRAAWGAGDRKEPYLGRCRHLKDPRPPMSFHRESRESARNCRTHGISRVFYRGGCGGLQSVALHVLVCRVDRLSIQLQKQCVASEHAQS